MNIKLHQRPQDLSEEVLMAYLQNFLDISDFRKIQNGKQMLQLIRKHSEHSRIKVAIRKVVGLFHCDVPAAKVCALQFLKEGLETGCWAIVEGIQKSMLNVFAEVIQYRPNIRAIQRGTSYFLQNINKNTSDEYIMNLIKFSTTYFRMIHECLYVWGAIYFPGSSYDKLRLKLSKKHQFPKWPEQFKFFTPRKTETFKSNCLFLIQKMAVKVNNSIQTNSINSKNSSKSITQRQNVITPKKAHNYSSQKIQISLIEEDQKSLNHQINNKNKMQQKNCKKSVKISKKRLQRKKLYDQNQDQNINSNNESKLQKKTDQNRSTYLGTIKEVSEEGTPANTSKNASFYQKQSHQKILKSPLITVPLTNTFNESFSSISEGEESDEAGGRYSPAETSQTSKEIGIVDNLRNGITSRKSDHSSQNNPIKQMQKNKIFSQQMIPHKVQQMSNHQSIKNTNNFTNFKQISKKAKFNKNDKSKNNENKDRNIKREQSAQSANQGSSSQQQRKFIINKIHQNPIDKISEKIILNKVASIIQQKTAIHANPINKQIIEPTNEFTNRVDLIQAHQNLQKRIKPQKIKGNQSIKTVYEKNINQLKIVQKVQKQQMSNKKQIRKGSQNNNMEQNCEVKKYVSKELQNGLEQDRQIFVTNQKKTGKQVDQKKKMLSLTKTISIQQSPQKTKNMSDLSKINKQININLSNSLKKKSFFDKDQKDSKLYERQVQKETMNVQKETMNDQKMTTHSIHPNSSIQRQKETTSFITPIRISQGAPIIIESQLSDFNIQSLKSTVKQQIMEEFNTFKSALLNNQQQKLNQSLCEIKSQIIKQFKLGNKDIKDSVTECSTQTLRYKSKNKFDRKQIYKKKAKMDEGKCVGQNILKQEYDDSLIYRKSKISIRDTQNLMNISNQIEPKLSKRLSLQQQVKEQLKPNTLLYALYRRKSLNL